MFSTGLGADNFRVHGTGAVRQVRLERHDRLDRGIRRPSRSGRPDRDTSHGHQIAGVHHQRAPLIVPVGRRQAPVRLDVRQLQQLVPGHVTVVDAHPKRVPTRGQG